MGKCLLLQWPGFYAHVLDAARASAEVPTVPEDERGSKKID
ncbi:hypothetical protein APHMUC_0361 [Anaplasma phagocytophilum str. ApMUC09]|uniref:Uncharacterized protein n=1 Tax=Anaplasma phagocytophilum str. ApMUC09 TaxID=1359152 RepID=A0A0F3N7M3_ANAPH|nr:hypothetical protein APHMUC_0361 [Anaplasma phagocytophilum str. ApMUC09]